MCRRGACVCGPTGKQLRLNRLFMTAGFLYFYIIDAKVSLKFFTNLDIVKPLPKEAKRCMGNKGRTYPEAATEKGAARVTATGEAGRQ